MSSHTTDQKLFDEQSTSELARQTASKIAGERYQQIIRILRKRPSCLFEVAAQIGFLDHQISGRFTDLAKLGVIEKTGERRVKPKTGCKCNVWRITDGQQEEQSV